MDFSIQLVPTVVYACFVLHNFCESGGGSLAEVAVKAQIRRNQIEEDMNKSVPDPIYSCTLLARGSWLETPSPPTFVKIC